MSNILHNFKPKFLSSFGNKIEGHAIHLNRRLILLLLKIDIPHVDSEHPSLRVLFVFDYQRISIQSFLEHIVALVCICQGETDCVG